MTDAACGVTVTYEARHGYITNALELRQPVVALSLGGLRRRIEALMVPDSVDVVLQLDGLAGVGAAIAQLDQRTALPDQCLHSAEADVRSPRRKSGFDLKPTSRNLLGMPIKFGFSHFFASHFSHNLRGVFAERGLS